MEPQMELDGDQHGYIAKYGSFTFGVLHAHALPPPGTKTLAKGNSAETKHPSYYSLGG